jgi:hypothetical protein
LCEEVKRPTPSPTRFGLVYAPFRPRGNRYSEEQLTAMRGGLTVVKYRARFLKKWGKR